MNHLRRDTRRERAWKLMRTLGSYTLTEIATLAGADVENIRHYHQCLVKAGYARNTGTKKQEGRPGLDKVYRLVKNTGPRPPVQKSLRFLFDPNICEYWSADPGLEAQVESVRSAECGVRDEIKKIRIQVRPGSFLDRAGKKGGLNVA